MKVVQAIFTMVCVDRIPEQGERMAHVHPGLKCSCCGHEIAVPQKEFDEASAHAAFMGMQGWHFLPRFVCQICTANGQQGLMGPKWKEAELRDVHTAEST